MSQKTTNLNLNVHYENTERNIKWLDGMDQNFEIIDDAIGDYFNSVISASNRIARSVDLSSVTTLSTTLQRANKGMNCCAVGKYIYIFGGEASPSSVYRFNTNDNTLSLLPLTLPIDCYSSCCEATRNKIYLFAINDGISGTDDILEFDIDNNLISILELKMPFKVSYSSSFNVDNIFYIVGGKDENNEEKDTIIRFNPSAMTITTLEVSLPVELSSSVSKSYSDYGYIFGGISSSVTQNKIYKFDTTNNTIIELPITLVDSIYGFSIIKNNDDIYILGGFDGINYYSDIYKYNATEGTLTKLEMELPMPLANACGSFRVSGFIFGGSNSNGTLSNILKFIE